MDNSFSNKNNSTNNKILSVKDLSKYFTKGGKIFKVLDELTFDIYEGDFFGVIGESGSGKSTTGKCIIRLLETNGGTVTFLDRIINNKKISKTSKNWLTKNMQMIFQDPMSSLNPRKNVLSLIAEPIIINKSLKQETKNLLNVCQKINRKFKYTFLYQDYWLNEQLLIPYYYNVINIFQLAIDSLMQLNVSSYTSLALLTDDITSIFNRLEVAWSTELKKLFDLSKKTKQLIYNNENTYNKYKNQYEIDHQLNDKNDTFDTSYAQLLDLRVKRDVLTQELEDLKNSLNSKYKEQNSIFIASLIADYKNQVALYKQKKLTTKDLFYYSLNKIKVAIAEDIIHILNKIDTHIYLSIDDIKEFTNNIQQKVSNKYQFLIEKITILSNMDDEVNEDLLNSLDKDKKYLALSPEIAEWFESYKNINKLIDKKIQEDFLSTSKSIKKEVSDLIKKSKLNKHVIINEIKRIGNELTRVESSIEKLSAIFKDQDIKYNEAIKQFNKNPSVDINANDFKKDFAPHINQQNSDLYYYKRQYKIQVKYIKKNIKDIFSYLKAYDFKTKDKNYDTNYLNLKNEFKNKMNNLIAYQLEQTSMLSQIDLYKSLRKHKHFIKFNYQYLKKVLMTEKVFHALNEVGLKNEHAFRYPHEFSGGQRQRIVIARSLISKPKFIIADEPISALDVSIQAQVVNIMKKLSQNQGITFMFIAHDLSMVNFLCNRLIILHKGKIVEKGNTNEIFNNPVHPYTISLIKASPELSKIHIDLSSFDFDANYDADYSIHNKPQFYKVPNDKDHYVFCSEEQFKKWVK